MPLLVLTVLSIPLTLVAAGFLIAARGARHGGAHRDPRRFGERDPGRADADVVRRTPDRNVLTRPAVWIRDEARWRDFAWLAFAATGGFVMSMLPCGLSSRGHHVIVLLIERAAGRCSWWR